MTKTIYTFKTLVEGMSRDAWPPAFEILTCLKKSKPIWQINIDSLEIEEFFKVHKDFNEAKPSLFGKIFNKNSFLITLDLLSVLESLWSLEGRPRCIGCNQLAQTATIKEVLRQIEVKYDTGVLALSYSMKNLEMGEVSIINAAEMFMAQSVLLNSKRFRLAELNGFESKYISDYETVEVVLWSGSLPLSEGSREDLLFETNRQLTSTSVLTLHLFDPALVLGTSDSKILKSFQVNDGLSCASCNKKFKSFSELFHLDKGSSDVKESRDVDLKNWELFGVKCLDFDHLTIQELCNLISKHDPESRANHKLNILNEFGFGSYEIGASFYEFSRGELLRLKLAQFFNLKVSELSLDLKFNLDIFLNEEKEKILKVINEHAALNLNEVQYESCSSEDNSESQLNNQIEKSRAKKESKNSKDGLVKVSDLELRNRSQLSFHIPLRKITAITGSSGSGKTAILEALANSNMLEFKKIYYRSEIDLAKNKKLVVLELLGISKQIGQILSQTYEARKRGFTPSDLNPVTSKYRCSNCRGVGVLSSFVESEDPQMLEECPLCLGLRYQTPLLAIKYGNCNLNEILTLTISEAEKIFWRERELASVFRRAFELGLGESKLGARGSEQTMSEIQRLFLLRYVLKLTDSDSLLLLDAPFLGGKQDDFDLIYRVLKEVTAHGNTVVISDNSEALIKVADYVIALKSEYHQMSPRRRTVVSYKGFLER